VRCVGCETELLTSSHYCECCGHRLSLHETSAFENAPVTESDHRAPDRSPASEARCESCGGPSAHGDLCRSCQQALDSFLGSGEPATPVNDPATAPAEAVPVEQSLWSQLMKSTAPPAQDPSDTRTPAEAVLSAPVLPEATMPVLPEATMVSADDKVAVAKAHVVMADEARAETVRTEEPKTQAVLPKGARTEATSAEIAPKPAVVNKRPNVPGPSQHRPQAIALATAAVVVAGISVGAYWLRIHEQPVIAGEEQQTLVVKDATVAARRSSASGLSAAPTTATKGRKSAAAPPSARASARPNPTASTPHRGVVAAQASVKAAPRPATEAPAPAVAPRPADVVATVLPPVLPEPPLGPFFETTTVNESPRIATRVEPQLPDEFRARPLSEIVIVRALVSQGGRPSRISLLRRSKTGPRLDNAVITAVNQWTFAPARKRGQAVSCWFNFGVPVG
jgi:protein TonB